MRGVRRDVDERVFGWYGDGWKCYLSYGSDVEMSFNDGCSGVYDTEKAFNGALPSELTYRKSMYITIYKSQHNPNIDFIHQRKQ